jgi:hypothetical protein
MRLLLLHGEGPLLDFTLRAGIVLPILFGGVTWLAWWLGRGQYAASGPARVVLKAGLAMLGLWLAGLANVVLGLALNMAIAMYVTRWLPEYDGSEAVFLALFLTPALLTGSAFVWWATRKRPGSPTGQSTVSTRYPFGDARNGQ